MRHTTNAKADNKKESEFECHPYLQNDLQNELQNERSKDKDKRHYEDGIHALNPQTYIDNYEENCSHWNILFVNVTCICIRA